MLNSNLICRERLENKATEKLQPVAADDALMKKVNLAVKVTEGRYLTAGTHTPSSIVRSDEKTSTGCGTTRRPCPVA